jgi:single-strand DNA-binding protein
MLNKVTLIGLMEKDPEIRVSQNGYKTLKLSLCTEEKFKDKHSGEYKHIKEWHNVVKFSPQETDKYSQGDMLFVEGKLRTSKYQNKSGIDVYHTSIIADKILTLKQKCQNGESPSPLAYIIDDDMPF